jgi:glycosyltransferase involved in cell wall biosynthesis
MANDFLGVKMTEKKLNWTIKDRIVYVVNHSFPHSSNGYAVRTHEIAKGIEENGCSVEVVTRPSYPFDTSENFENLLDVSHEIDGIRYFYIPSPQKSKMDHRLWLEKSINSYREFFQVFKPTLVVSASNWELAQPAQMAAEQLGLPFAYEVRGFWEISRSSVDLEFANTKEYSDLVAQETAVASKADRVFTLNDFMKQELMHRGIDKNKIQLMPNGFIAKAKAKTELEIKFREVSNRKPTIGYVGSFARYEGLEKLVQIIAELKKQGQIVNLLLVGSSNPLGKKGDDCEVTKELYQLALKLGVEEYVNLVGRVEPSDLDQYFNEIDLIVIPRKKLPVSDLVSPIKQLEAAARSKAMLLSDIAPFNEFIDAGIAEKISSDVISSIALQISQLLADKDKLNALGKKAFDWVYKARQPVHIVKALVEYVKELPSGFNFNQTSPFLNKELDILPCNSSLSIKRRAMVFTNLGLTTIDGSSVFIANVVKIFSGAFDEVHLLSAQKIGENFLERIISLDNLTILDHKSEEIKRSISDYNQENCYDIIFVRGWGDVNLWFDSSYSHKISYYCPLSENPSEDEKRVYKEVKLVAFQTEELKDKVFESQGEKDYFLLPPLINLSNTVTNTKSNAEILKISYVGTIRKECFGEELLSALLTVLKRYPNQIKVNLAIGKVFYTDFEEKKKILSLLEGISKDPSVVFEEKVSQEKCDDIFTSSDIGFSLWENTTQNSYQVSTKMLDCISKGCPVVCFRTSKYERLLGKDYPYFIDSPKEILPLLVKLIVGGLPKPKVFSDNYALSNFSYEWHVLNIIEKFSITSPRSVDLGKTLFNNQFDKVYGLHVNESELSKLDYLTYNFGLSIVPHKGVNGKDKFKDSYTEYLEGPLQTEWERRAQKKRLSIGAMGHLASFIDIAEDAIRNGFKKILILEADILLHKDCWSLNFSNRPDSFKIWYLGAGKWNQKVESIQGGYIPNQTTGTFAVAFDISALKECIEYWMKYIEPTDVAMWPVTDKYGASCVVSYPNLIICDVATSLTGSGRSQVELSKRFDWELDKYQIESVEVVNKYCEKLTIKLNILVDGACLEIVCQNKTINEKCSANDIIIDVGDVILEIRYVNTLISKIIIE